jgi:hypothetical protein
VHRLTQATTPLGPRGREAAPRPVATRVTTGSLPYGQALVSRSAPPLAWP